METKERKAQREQLLSDLAKSDETSAKWARDLIKLQLEDARDRLVDAEGVDIPRIQGEARLMERWHRLLVAANALLGAS